MGQPELNSLIEEAAAKASAFALWRLPHAHTAHLCVSFSSCGHEYNGKSGFLFHPFAQTPQTPAVFIQAEAEASCPVQDIVPVDLKHTPRQQAKHLKPATMTISILSGNRLKPSVKNALTKLWLRAQAV